ncbi:unnamed protein product [Victoria cruziana]
MLGPLHKVSISCRCDRSFQGA